MSSSTTKILKIIFKVTIILIFGTIGFLAMYFAALFFLLGVVSRGENPELAVVLYALVAFAAGSVGAILTVPFSLKVSSSFLKQLDSSTNRQILNQPHSTQ